MIAGVSVALDCATGSGVNFSGPAMTVPTGQLPNASSARIQGSSGNSPTFTSGGLVSGRIEVKPSELRLGKVHV